jgi:hypothetical protein
VYFLVKVIYENYEYFLSDVAASCTCVFVVSGAGRLVDFGQEIYILPFGDMQCAIETRMSAYHGRPEPQQR